MTQFAHISPTAYLDIFAAGRPFHLTLAHLVEEDDDYASWYANMPRCYGTTVILDNSAFEMTKQGKPMYESSKLLEMGKKVKADYIVMSDYPGEPAMKTIEAAQRLAPIFHEAGFGTFFVPQAEVGNVEGVLESFMWATEAEEVDYIGVSILTAPNMFGVEKGNNLQRFLSRWKLCQLLDERGFFAKAYENGKKIHFLGMVDGPNEVALVAPWLEYIATWDSSAAVWAGLNGIKFDETPTGLRDGKFEKEVDFSFETTDDTLVNCCKENMKYIDYLCSKYHGEHFEI